MPAAFGRWGTKHWPSAGKLDNALLAAMSKEQSVFQVQPQLAAARAAQFKGRYDGPEGARSLLMSAGAIRTYRGSPQRGSSGRGPWRLDAAKQAASLWLGIIAFEEKDYPVAIDYFTKREALPQAAPDGPWAATAQYNLGRAYEANGQLREGTEMYEDDDSPQRHGNLLGRPPAEKTVGGSAGCPVHNAAMA